jgi:hypothetical protein
MLPLIQTAKNSPQAPAQVSGDSWVFEGELERAVFDIVIGFGLD